MYTFLFIRTLYDILNRFIERKVSHQWCSYLALKKNTVPWIWIHSFSLSFEVGSAFKYAHRFRIKQNNNLGKKVFSTLAIKLAYFLKAKHISKLSDQFNNKHIPIQDTGVWTRAKKNWRGEPREEKASKAKGGEGVKEKQSMGSLRENTGQNRGCKSWLGTNHWWP